MADYAHAWTPTEEIPRACIVQAAQDYRLPVKLILGVMRVENAKCDPRAVRENRDGSRDIGLMQHNSRYWARYFQERFGIRLSGLFDPCNSIRAAAYALRYEINRTGDFWRGVGNYHSGIPSSNRSYALSVYRASLTASLPNE